MANKRIPDLTDGTAIPLAAADLMEVWNAALARSEKKTATQTAAFASGVIGASGINFAAIVTWAGTLVIIGPDGSVQWANQVSSLGADGGLTVNGGAITLNADGSASFANATVNLATNGQLLLPHIAMQADGSVDFDGGAIIAGLSVSGKAFVIGSDGELGAFGAAPQTQQTVSPLTNSVTSGGTDDVVAEFSDLNNYAADAQTIHDDIYQLARKVSQLQAALQLYGLVAP
jgi:hypothetical protein